MRCDDKQLVAHTHAPCCSSTTLRGDVEWNNQHATHAPPPQSPLMGVACWFRYPLVGFIRVEFVDPEALGFLTPAGARQEVTLRDLAAEAGTAPRKLGLVDAFEEEEVEGSTFVVKLQRAGPLGLELTATPHGRVIVKAVVPGGAADKLGVMKGDALLSVNDEPVVGATLHLGGGVTFRAVSLIAFVCFPLLWFVSRRR